jgi:hypothetical protein
MEKRIKTKIIRNALKIHNFRYKDFSGDIWELPELVDEDPTEFIETCVEEAYKEGVKNEKR